jgi:hypothetical protein
MNICIVEMLRAAKATTLRKVRLAYLCAMGEKEMVREVKDEDELSDGVCMQGGAELRGQEEAS